MLKSSSAAVSQLCVVCGCSTASRRMLKSSSAAFSTVFMMKWLLWWNFETEVLVTLFSVTHFHLQLFCVTVSSWKSHVNLINKTTCNCSVAGIIYIGYRVTTSLENLEISGNLTAVRDFTKSQGNVRGEILLGKSCLKLFIVSCIFVSIQVFSRSLFCVKY